MECPKCLTDNPDDSKFCKECATSLTGAEGIQASFTKTLETPAPGLKPGTLFAERYEIVEELGRGGMGKVYKVVDTQINEEMALKLLKPEIVAHEGMIDRFRNELKIARKISHKNICRMFDINEVDGTPFITMEYVAGEDLKSLVRRKEKLAEEEVLNIAQQVCEGLAEAHELGVIHRDLKPQNIMIDETGRAKIMDFGIARSMEAPSMTQTGMIIGTPDYLSPEQADGKEVDHRSDIYSLGVILYELVTGNVPFSGDTALSVVLKHKSQYPLHPQKLNPDLSDDLSRLILICLEKDRERRYQSAAELLADLRNIEEGFPLGTKIQPRRETFVSRFFGNKLYVVVSVFALASLIVLFWLGFIKPKQTALSFPTDKPRVAILLFKNNTGDAELDYLRCALSDQLIMDLEQSTLLYILPINERDEILSALNQQEAVSYSAEVMDEIVKQKPINHVIQGNYILSGDDFRINLSVQKAGKWKTIASETTSGHIDNFLPLIDDLTRKIKPHFELTSEQIAADIDEDIASITTSSQEALKLYQQGRKLHMEGDYHQSIEVMKKAVEIDPEFAMAYRSLWASYGHIADYEKQKEALQKAFDLVIKGRGSEREKLIIHAGREKNLLKRIAKAEQLLALYPDDPQGIHYVAWTYLSGLEEIEKAIEVYETAIQNGSTHTSTYANLALAYAGNGMYEKAEETTKYYDENISKEKGPSIPLAYWYISQGKYTLALDVVDKAITARPNDEAFIGMIGDIYHLQSDFERAEKTYRRIFELEHKIAHMSTRDRLAFLFLTQGKLGEAERQMHLALNAAEELKQSYLVGVGKVYLGRLQLIAGRPDEALNTVQDMSPSRRVLVLRCDCYLTDNALAEAQETALELKDLLQNSPSKKRIREYYRLQGEIELERGNFAEAIDFQKKAISLYRYEFYFNRQDIHAFFMAPLAYAYYESGDLDQALEEFTRISNLTSGRLKHGHLYAKSFYMLGKIYEEKDWKGKAIEKYEKFLELWKEADPGIEEIEDARQRLAALK